MWALDAEVEGQLMFQAVERVGVRALHLISKFLELLQDRMPSLFFRSVQPSCPHTNFRITKEFPAVTIRIRRWVARPFFRHGFAEQYHFQDREPATPNANHDLPLEVI